MADSEKYFTKTVDGQLSVATVAQSGEIIPEESRPGDKYTTALVQTDDGPQLCVKTFDLNGGGGGGDVPDNVYTQDNLVAGTNISITPVSQPVLDANTLGVWHLDDETGANAITTGEYAQTTLFTSAHVYTTSFSKFGTGSCLINTVGSFSAEALLLNISDTIASHDFTLDMWCRTPTGNNINYSLTINLNMTSALYIRVSNANITIGGNSVNTAAGTWHHLAIERYNNTLNGYVDGTLIYTASTSQTARFDITVGNENQFYIPGACLDEVRLSNVARYQGQNFTPFDVAYSADLPPQYQINNTQDMSSYLQNKTTAKNSLLLSLKEPTSATGTNSISISNSTSSSLNQNGSESVVIGDGVCSRNSVISIGYQTQVTGDYAVAIGRGAFSTGGEGKAGNSSTAVGSYANANQGTAIGAGTKTQGKSIALGAGIGTSNTQVVRAGAYKAIVIGVIGVAGDLCEATAKEAIQLGNGANANAKTLQVYEYQLLDGNTGLIPPERLGTGYDATKTQVLKHVNGVLTWVDEA